MLSNGLELGPMPLPAWAWEGLRRNPAYQKDYRLSKAGIPSAIILDSGAKLLRARKQFSKAEKWGLVCFADPDIPAIDGHVLWLPNVLPSALRVSIRPIANDEHANPDDVIDLRRIDLDRLLYEASTGARHIRLGGNSTWVQLICERPISLGERGRLVIRIDYCSRAQRLLETAANLVALSANGKLPKPSCSEKREQTLRSQLTAYDIWHAGGDLRAIGEAVFPAEWMARDWKGSGNYLKDRTRRLRDAGERFVSGGYIDLLQKRSG